MISMSKKVMIGDQYYDIRCLSTDTKPTKNVKNGSVLIEIDTGDVYLFDEYNQDWNNVPINYFL